MQGGTSMKKVKNFARFYALFKRLPGSPDKEELVLTYTKNRTSSLRDMTEAEYDAMCDDLQQTIDGTTASFSRVTELKKHRSKVLYWIQKNGVDTTDWDRINAYCLDPRIAGKVFRELTIPELETLERKLKAIARKTGSPKVARAKKSSPEYYLSPEARELLKINFYQLN